MPKRNLFLYSFSLCSIHFAHLAFRSFCALHFQWVFLFNQFRLARFSWLRISCFSFSAFPSARFKISRVHFLPLDPKTLSFLCFNKNFFSNLKKQKSFFLLDLLLIIGSVYILNYLYSTFQLNHLFLASSVLHIYQRPNSSFVFIVLLMARSKMISYFFFSFFFRASTLFLSSPLRNQPPTSHHSSLLLPPPFPFFQLSKERWSPSCCIAPGYQRQIV